MLLVPLLISRSCSEAALFAVTELVNRTSPVPASKLPALATVNSPATDSVFAPKLMVPV